MADDYENIDQVILRDVNELAVKLRFTVERFEVVEALRGLIGDGPPIRHPRPLAPLP